jgi:hypothetical protein
MTSKGESLLARLGKRMLGFSTSASGCCGGSAAPAERMATAEPQANSACCTPTVEATAAGACCEESMGSAPPVHAEHAQAVKDAVKAREGAAALHVTTGGTSCCGGGASCSDPITSNLDGDEAAEVPAEALTAVTNVEPDKDARKPLS